MHDANFEYDVKPKLIFLYGSGRSGTTWLEERIVNSLNAEVIFEPLNSSVGYISNKYAYSYLGKDDLSEELTEFFKQLISGKLKSIWTKYRILPSRLIPNKHTFLISAEFKTWLKRFPTAWRNIRFKAFTGHQEVKLIKMIRGNLLFPWVINKFPEALHLFIIRHPAAVIESRMRLDLQVQKSGIITGSDDWSSYILLQKYINNSDLPEMIQKGIYQVNPLETLSEFECHCVLWCVENKLALEQFLSEDLFILYYEHLLRPDHPVWCKLAKMIGSDKASLTCDMNIPSQQSSGDFGKNSGLKQRAVRVEKLIDIAGERCIEILQYYLDLFEIKQYISNQPNPTE